MKIKIERIIGFVLLTPSIISVFLFILNLLFKEIGTMYNLSRHWTGGINWGDSGGGGFTSAAPIYFGLMAIAGAYLIKNTGTKITY